MRVFQQFFILFLLALVASCSSSSEDEVPENPFLDDPDHQFEIVKISTRLGDMRLWLSFQTPKHRDNFLELVEQDFYDELIFHRVIDGFVIQGGDPNGDGTGGPGFTVEAEIDTKLRHIQGALGAARQGDAANPQRRSSGSQFYIVEPPEGAPFLDGDFTVFGQLVSGIETVQAIATQPTNNNDKPLEDVTMTEVEIELLTAGQLQDQFSFNIRDF